MDSIERAACELSIHVFLVSPFEERRARSPFHGHGKMGHTCTGSLAVQDHAVVKDFA